MAQQLPTQLPERKHPAHWPTMELGNRSAVVFLTVCVRDRRRLLARPQILGLLTAIWHEAADWAVGNFVLMPDHLHLFCAPRSREATPLGNWVRFWKSRSTRDWPYAHEKPIWQPDYWDRQLRRGEGYAAKWDYVVNNPVRAGLCQRAEDWPFRGEIAEIRFHDD